MSKKIDNIEMVCPDCGKTFTFSVYKTIWGEYPENREMVMNNTINVVSCPYCNFSAPVRTSLFYTNSKDGFAVWYEPDYDEMIDRDTAGYKQYMGENSYFATAPRISDWEEFKETIRKFERGELKGGKPQMSAEAEKSMTDFMTMLAQQNKPKPMDSVKRFFKKFLGGE